MNMSINELFNHWIEIRFLETNEDGNWEIVFGQYYLRTYVGSEGYFNCTEFYKKDNQWYGVVTPYEEDTFEVMLREDHIEICRYIPRWEWATENWVTENEG